MKKLNTISVIALAVILAAIVWIVYRFDDGETGGPIVSEFNGENIEVDEPDDGETIGSILKIEGKARVFEGTVNYRLRDDEGNILAEGFTTSEAPATGEFGSFTVNVPYKTPEDERGTLEVFSISAEDGSEIDKVRITILFNF